MEHNHQVALGKKIKELRKLRGWSQEELASLIDFKQPNIQRIEAGKHSTGIDIVGRICDALDCTILIVPNEELGEEK